MIEKTYENPNKPKPVAHKVATYTFGNSGKAEEMANGYGKNFNEHWAKKMNITLEEFVKRDVAVQNAAKGVVFYKNAAVFPKKPEDYQRLGRCRVLDVIRSYRDWPEELEWDPNTIYIVEAYSEENKFSVFRATGGYFTSYAPTITPPVIEEGKV